MRDAGRIPPRLRRTAASNTAFDCWDTFCTPLESPIGNRADMAGATPAMTPRPALLFFPGLRGRTAGGHPRSPRPSPVRGKTTQPLALPLWGITALFAADGADKCPGMGMGNAPPGGLAHFLRAAHRRISKKCAKGGLRNKCPKMRINAAVGKGRLKKLLRNFFLAMGGVTGAQPP
jgi:hypothetical protein